jgi:hypothetical protein
MLVDIVLSESLGMNIPWTHEHRFQAKQEVPLRSFGVFVTARRSQPLQKWPIDIHGCIGDWNADFHEMSRETLVEKACEVGYKAFWKDDRRNYFQQDILKEPNSVCEIDFLMLPVIPVDPFTGKFSTNGKQFSNDTHGLIVESVNGSRATYLPGVFSRISWKQLKASLLQKAGVVGGRFFAYTIRQVKVPIGMFCDSEQVALCLKTNFKHMLFQQVRKPYPFFPIQYTNGRFQMDKSEEVRNTGLLLDLVEAFQEAVPFTKIQERFLTQAIGHASRLPLSDQAKAFLLPCLSAMGYRTEYLCRDLMKKLKTMDRQFAFGETVVGIAKGGCKYLLLPYKSYLLKSYPLVGADAIFQINWDCQALVAMGVKPFPKPVLDSLVAWVTNAKFSERTFTNLLAVSWEAIQTVYPHCSLYYKKVLDPFRLSLCWLLQQRVDPTYPTVYLMVRGDARLDITSHVLGGWKIQHS